LSTLTGCAHVLRDTSVNWAHALEIISVHRIKKNSCYPVSVILMICEVVVMSLNCMNEICGYISVLIRKLGAA